MAMIKDIMHYHTQERRRYSRVSVNQSGWLLVDNGKQHVAMIQDLSIGGALLKGVRTLHPGMQCELELNDNDINVAQVIKLSAEVIRVDSTELALKFVDMDKESYMFLQTMLLYKVDDPLSIVTEFQDDFVQSSLIASC